METTRTVVKIIFGICALLIFIFVICCSCHSNGKDTFKNMEKTTLETNRLTAVLDAKRAQLMDIKGVTGTGIGLTSQQDAQRIVIQLFTDSPDRLDAINHEAQAIIGNEQDFETIAMPIPRAQ